VGLGGIHVTRIYSSFFYYCNLQINLAEGFIVNLRLIINRQLRFQINQFYYKKFVLFLLLTVVYVKHVSNANI